MSGREALGSPENPVTIVLLGATQVGKTSLLRCLDQTDAPVTPTIGLEWHQVRLHLEHGQTVDVDACDLGGREGLRDLSGSLAKHVRGVLLCYDLTDPQSFAYAGRWLRSVRASIDARYNTDDWPNTSVVLVGTKQDLPGAEPPPEVASFVQDQALVTHVMTSCKTGQGCAEGFVALVGDILLQNEQHEERRKSRLGAPSSPSAKLPVDPLVDVVQVGEQGYELLLAEPKRYSQCIAKGLTHRTVHVWIVDSNSGHLLIQQKVRSHICFPGLWHASASTLAGREHSTDAARQALLAQLGVRLNDDTGASEEPEQAQPLTLLATCKVTTPLPAASASPVGGTGPVHELVDLYLVELPVGELAVDPQEALGAKLVATEAALAGLEGDPASFSPGSTYVRALR